MFNCGRGDKCVGKSDPELPRDPTGPLGHSTVDAELSERREQLAGEVRSGVAGEEFGSGDHRVVEPVPTGCKSNRAAEVVDEDVGVDEKVSHAATRHARGAVGAAPNVAVRAAVASASTVRYSSRARRMITAIGTPSESAI